MKHPLSIQTIRALLFIKLHRPDIDNVDFLKNNPQLVRRLSHAYNYDRFHWDELGADQERRLLNSNALREIEQIERREAGIEEDMSVAGPAQEAEENVSGPATLPRDPLPEPKKDAHQKGGHKGTSEDVKTSADHDSEIDYQARAHTRIGDDPSKGDVHSQESLRPVIEISPVVEAKKELAALRSIELSTIKERCQAEIKSYIESRGNQK